MRNYNMLQSYNKQPLTLDQVRQTAPSVFAETPHESRSSRYAFIPTSDVLRSLLDNGFGVFSVTQSLTRDPSRRDFTKHMLRLRHQSTFGGLAVGDSFPEVVLINGHDGSTRYKLMGGIFRMICGNGSVIADSLVGSINVMHTGNVIEEVTAGSISLVEHMPEVIDAVARWKAINLQQSDRLALAEAAHIVRFADSTGKTSTPLLPERLLEARRVEDKATDLWTTHNVIQENVIRGGQSAYSYATGRRTTHRITGIDQNVKLNRALWALSSKLAELKAGA